MRQDEELKIYEVRKANEKRALEVRRIDQVRSNEEKLKLCNKYIYELNQKEEEREKAASFHELEQKNEK